MKKFAFFLDNMRYYYIIFFIKYIPILSRLFIYVIILINAGLALKILGITGLAAMETVQASPEQASPEQASPEQASPEIEEPELSYQEQVRREMVGYKHNINALQLEAHLAWLKEFNAVKALDLKNMNEYDLKFHFSQLRQIIQADISLEMHDFNKVCAFKRMSVEAMIDEQIKHNQQDVEDIMKKELISTLELYNPNNAREEVTIAQDIARYLNTDWRQIPAYEPRVEEAAVPENVQTDAPIQVEEQNENEAQIQAELLAQAQAEFNQLFQEEQQARIAAEEQQARIAAEEQQARIAAEEQQARIAAEEQQARIAAEEQQARIAAEQQARIAAEQQARIEQQQAIEKERIRQVCARQEQIDFAKLDEKMPHGPLPGNPPTEHGGAVYIIITAIILWLTR